MFWHVVLPFQVTCCILFVAVVALTTFASPKTWHGMKSFFVYSAIALVAFIPSCVGIMVAVDAVRFGDFNYASYNDIPDFRSQRYLPGSATEIQMRKHANGYFARYKLSADEFSLYLDDLWQQCGGQSASAFSDEGEPVAPEVFKMTFGDLGWDCPPNAIVYYSPREPDGGGAAYYVDAVSNLIFQRTGFW